MGKAYKISCKECGYTDTFYLGTGRNDENAPAAVMKDILEGKYGEDEAKNALLYGDKIKVQRELYRCRKCGNLEEHMKTQIYMESGMIDSLPYYCTKCGSLLGQVKASDIKKQMCPKCGKAIEVTETFNWDIAPAPEENE